MSPISVLGGPYVMSGLVNLGLHLVVLEKATLSSVFENLLVLFRNDALLGFESGQLT